MRTRSALPRVARAALALVLALVLCACQSDTTAATPDFSNIDYVANLATMDCYYHVVSKNDTAGNGMLWGLGDIGKKRMWFEFDATVELGVDATQIDVSGPDANGLVTVYLPPIEVIGEPDIDTSSMTTPITDTGWFTEITQQEKTQYLNAAMDYLLEEVDADATLKGQAKDRVKDILEQWIVNLGDSMGQTYTVKFVDIVEGDASQSSSSSSSSSATGSSSSAG